MRFRLKRSHDKVLHHKDRDRDRERDGDRDGEKDGEENGERDHDKDPNKEITIRGSVMIKIAKTTGYLDDIVAVEFELPPVESMVFCSSERP